ncbi:MAG: hypothetical protein ACXAEI_09320 [Candidatus Hodarchaeales archaeon]
MRIAVIGAGAIGGVIAAHLTRQVSRPSKSTSCCVISDSNTEKSNPPAYNLLKEGV